MKIVIFTGGTGSIALQDGLYHALDSNLDGVDTKIMVNAYDNGLSTGAVRRVMGGRILGPSDVRKNQAMRLRLKDQKSPWLSFLNLRFTLPSCNAREFCRDQTMKLLDALDGRGPNTDCRSTLFAAMDEYFNLPLAATVDYDDFSLANIIYAGLAHGRGDSLRAAASTMAELMAIPDNVLLNDDESLFLGAITRSGRRIADEGAIVTWCNEADPFVDIFFTDIEGNDRKPRLCLEAWRAIVEADLIILSCGTQWSSLIPTYASDGFRAAVNQSKATILMLMNRSPDKDAPSQSASDIINILVPRYFDANRVHVLADRNAHCKLQTLNQAAIANVASFTQADLSRPADPPDKYDPNKLADAVGYVVFKGYLESDFYLFDYDDTLVGRGGTFPRSSRFNINAISRLNWLTEVGICTGNTIRAVHLKGEPAAVDETHHPVYKPLLVFADGGVNKYSYDTHPVVCGAADCSDPVKCVSPGALLPTAGPHCAPQIIEALHRAGIPLSKIDDRGNALIAIRPVDAGYRRAVMCLAQHLIHDSGLEVRECGTTTVEICRPTLSKACTLKYLCGDSTAATTVTYVGDEFESGNDSDIERLANEGTRIKCLHVASPAATAFFIETLMSHLTKNVDR